MQFSTSLVTIIMICTLAILARFELTRNEVECDDASMDEKVVAEQAASQHVLLGPTTESPAQHVAHKVTTGLWMLLV